MFRLMFIAAAAAAAAVFERCDLFVQYFAFPIRYELMCIHCYFGKQSKLVKITSFWYEIKSVATQQNGWF